MNEQHLIEHLLLKKHLIKISGIAADTGINKTRLQLWVTGKPDGHGRHSKLSPDEVEQVANVVNSLSMKK